MEIVAFITMATIKMKVKKSDIQGLGLFTDEFVKKGKVIMVWLFDAKLIDETTYISEQQKGNVNMINTGSRAVGDVFLHTDEKPRYENFINHSENPNVLYCAGVCYALKDIEKDTELTTDYTYLLSPKDEPVVDVNTSKKITGVSALECLKKTSQLLADLFREINEESGLETTINSPHCLLPDTKPQSTSVSCTFFPNVINYRHEPLTPIKFST